MANLNQIYFYQNPKTNQPSSSTLSSKQLCRILCPATSSSSSAAASASNNKSAPSSSSSSSSSSIIRGETLVIEFDPIRNEYDTKQGWVAISSIPLFQYVTSSWYYESKSGTNETSESNARVKGPISCRELASLYYKQNHINDATTRVWSSSFSLPSSEISTATTTTATTTETDDKTTETAIDDKTTETATETTWKLMSELPLLKLAMEAFQDIVLNLSDATVNDNSNDNAIAKESSSIPQEFNEQDMIFDDDDNDNDNDNSNSNSDKVSENDAKDKQQIKTKDDKEKEEYELLLKEFLSSTGGSASTGTGTGTAGNDYDDNDNEEEYESDGGTKYIKIKNQWIDAKTVDRTLIGKKRPLSLQSQENNTSTFTTHNNNNNNNNNDNPLLLLENKKKKKKKKSTKPKFSNKHSKHWIYVTNLPNDTNETEVANFFSKAGVLDINPETLKPKIKLYRHKQSGRGGGGLGLGACKGDASICYAKFESVTLAIQLLDDSIFRTTDDFDTQKKITVQQAKFEQKVDDDDDGHNNGDGNSKKKKKSSISERKRQVARIAKLQAITWDEGDYNGRITGGIKGLRIIVLKHVFTLEEIRQRKKMATTRNKTLTTSEEIDVANEAEDEFLKSIEGMVRKDCEQFGIVEKITIFSKNVDGVVIVKLSQPSSASDAIRFYNTGDNKMVMNGHGRGHGQAAPPPTIEASYWDGVTDFTVRDEVQEEKETNIRHEEFGNWLDTQELPDEFELKVET